MQSNQYQVQYISSIQSICAEEWGALVENDHPFLKHAFLAALEIHDCLEPYGWLPHHIVIFDSQNQLLAAMPYYEKHNNYGEFVFDQAWEQAWNQIGLPYYPKMVTATPYTPVMGPRFLIKPSLTTAEKECLFHLLYQSLTDYCEHQQMSGSHILFTSLEQQQTLATQNDIHLYRRSGFQFHWHNHQYQDFDDFLQSLKPKKRKNISRERRSVAQAGIQFRILDGHQATDLDWENFDYFYQKTFVEKWSTPTMNLGFFKALGKTMPDNIVLVLADLNNKCIAGALMFRSQTHLYGRHWGCAQEVKDLHFETCYYQGIGYAIENNLQTFEPGAGGEHKIARGFLPIQIDSFHWLPLNPFGENLDRFIEQESLAVTNYIQDCLTHSPFKQTP